MIGPKRRRPWPMPIEVLIDHPIAIALPCAGYGALARLVHHFWLTDCKPLPATPRELRTLARAHPGVWKQYEPDILAYLKEVCPILRTYWLGRQVRRGIVFSLQARAREAKLKHGTRRLHEQPEYLEQRLLDIEAHGVGPKRRQDIVAESVTQRPAIASQSATKKKEPGAGFRDV